MIMIGKGKFLTRTIGFLEKEHHSSVTVEQTRSESNVFFCGIVSCRISEDFLPIQSNLSLVNDSH